MFAIYCNFTISIIYSHFLLYRIVFFGFLYGGAYIDDVGNLVIYVKEETSAAKLRINDIGQEIKQVINSHDFISKPATYSYNELNSVMDTLNSYKYENVNCAVANNFNLYWLSDTDNNIIIELDKFNEREIQNFKQQVIDSPIIIFKESSGKLINEVNLNPGQKISSSSASASMGYRARRKNASGVSVDGLVTAAHFASTNTSVVLIFRRVGGSHH